MLKKLELDFLEADLAAVEVLLASRSEADDPVGFLQYTCRKAAIDEQLQRLKSRPDLHAELGIFFGGGPVENAHGIDVEFAAKALNDIRALITAMYAVHVRHGADTRARVDFTDRSGMLMTDVVRGEIGIVLDEPIDATHTAPTPLRVVMSALVDTLAGLGADNAAVFDATVTALGPELRLSSMQLFVRLDEYRATLRLVCGIRELVLDASAVGLARRRLQEAVGDQTGVHRSRMVMQGTSNA